MKNNKVEKTENNKKWKSTLLKGGVGFLAFALGLGATYFLIPGRVENIDLGMPDEPEQAPETYFDRLIKRVTPIISDGGAEEAFGLEANLDDFTITWPNNEIKIDGQITANIKSLRELAFSIDLDAEYNGKSIDLGLAYTDSTLYICTKDLRLKQSFITVGEAAEELEELINYVEDLFFNPSNPDGMQIDLQMDALLGALIDGLDLSSLGGGGVPALKFEETEDDTYAYTNLKIGIDENTEIGIKLTIEKETESLVNVDLGEMNFGNVSIKGALDCRTDSKIKVYGFDDEHYTYKNHGKFVSLISYKSWIDDIFTLLNTRTIGLDLSASLKDDNYSYGFVNASIDLDASRFEPINFIGKVIGPELLNGSSEEEQVEETTDEELDIVEILNNFDFNVNLELGNYKLIDQVYQMVDYSNLGLAYFKDSDEKHNGYLTFNEKDDETAVMRAKIDVDTINYLISEITKLVEQKDTKKAIKRAEAENNLLDSFVAAINDGRYDGILDLLENIKNDEKTIEITVNLAPLGFGDNAKVILKLDAEKVENQPTKVISIVLENFKISTLEINAEINTRKYNKNGVERIDAIRNKFDVLDFVPGTFEQVENILDTKTTGLKLSGTAFDEQNLGFTFDGWAQMDLGNNNGFGHIEFDEYKYAGKMQTPHTVDISIDNKDGDHSKNDMLFEYRETLKGKFTLKTFDDLIDLVMVLLRNQTDKRFIKFLGPIYDKIIGSVLVTSIKNKDYLALSQSSLLTSIKQVDGGNAVEIVLSKELLMYLLPNDLTLRINFKTDSKNQKCLDSISIVNLDALGKKINATIQLTDFDKKVENPVDLTAKFLDFSDIAVLLAFGIDTINLDYYHVKLDADVRINLPLLDKIKLDKVSLDCHLLLENDKLKVYCSLPKSANPLIDMSAEFVFEPSTEEDDLLGGRFYILRKDRPTLLQRANLLFPCKKQDVLFVATDEYFGKNIVEYLLKGLLCLGDDSAGSIVNKINESSSNKEEKDPKYENLFTDTGFVYTENVNNNTYTWKTGIDIGAITESTVVSPIEAVITGEKIGDKSFLKKVHADLNIISLIKINADIELIDIGADVSNFPTSSYNSVINYYTGDINNIIDNLSGYVVAK